MNKLCIDNPAKRKTNTIQLIQSVWAEIRPSILYSSTVYVQARLSAHTDWISCMYIWRNILLFHFVVSSTLNYIMVSSTYYIRYSDVRIKSTPSLEHKCFRIASRLQPVSHTERHVFFLYFVKTTVWVASVTSIFGEQLTRKGQRGCMQYLAKTREYKYNYSMYINIKDHNAGNTCTPECVAILYG